MGGTTWRKHVASLGFGVATVLALGCYTGLGPSAAADEDPGGGATDAAAEDGDSSADSDGGDSSADAQWLGPGVCQDTYDEFRDEVWTAFMATDCYGCHNPSGLARATQFVLHDAARPGYLTENLQTLRTVAMSAVDGVALPLLKMSEEVPHAGELRFATDSPEYTALADLLDQLENPKDCKRPSDYDALAAELVELDALPTLRRATFALVGHPPSADQEGRVAEDGWDAFDAVLDEVLDEPAFAARIAEIYNEVLLTDSFLLRGNYLLFRVDDLRYPDRDWFEATDDPNAGRAGSIRGLTRAPLALVEHTVREGLPFTEILLADYTMVNPFSSRVYGLGVEGFDDPDDPDEYIPASLPDIPHAGLLTTLAFLNQYPNTDTNLNRHRARNTYRLFQSSDVLRLSLGAIDAAAIDDENPTLTHNDCAVCHAVVDPVASAFQNWGNAGTYRLASELEEPWPDDIRGAGFAGEAIPEDQRAAMLQWLAPRLVDNPRFAVSVVHTIASGLLRQTPRLEPTDPYSATYYEDIVGFAFEDTVFKAIAASFVESNYDMRTLVRALIRSPLYRAVGADPQISDEKARMLSGVGMAHPLRPTQLYARIEERTGYAWQPDDLGSAPVQRTLQLLFGEIDSVNTTTRLAEANGLYASFITRMADQVACRVVASEYATEPEARRLLPLVSFEDTPDTAGGAQNIAANLRYLHDYLFSTRPEAPDQEIDTALALFEAVRAEGLAGIEAGELSTQVSQPCRNRSTTLDGQEIAVEDRLNFDGDYTARAWMAVLAYLLSDYRFTHE